MDWLLDPFSSDITQRALLAGLLAAVTCALIGTWVVVRGLTFMGDALAHGVLPGVAVASVGGVNLIAGAFASVAVMVAGITIVNRRARLGGDTAIGLLFVGMLALGVVIISRQRTFASDATGFLFGSILGVDSGDLWVQAFAALLAVIGVLVLHRPFLVLSFNEDKAAALGLRPGLAHAAMLTLVAVAVVSSFRAVGTLLVFALLVAPPATATLLVRRLPTIMITAAGLGALSCVVGLVISYHWQTAAGATMAGVAVAIFFVVLTVRELATSRRLVGATDL